MIDEVEITNVGGPKGVASEATLASLVAAISRGDTARERSLRLESLAMSANAKSIKNSNKEQGIFAKAVSSAAGVVGGLGKEFALGGDRLSNFSQHILGAGSSIQGLIEYLDSSVDRFRNLSSVGASFNNSIFDMIKTSSTAGMSLDDFNNLVQNNSQTLRQLGGSVTNGTKRFSDLSKSLRAGDTGRRLFDLGFTIAGVNDGMISFISIQQMQGRLQGRSNASLIEGSQNYLKEIDLLSKATGKSRQALMESTEALNGNVRFQALQQNALKDGASNLDMNLAAAASFLPEFTDGLIDISSGTVTTEFGKALEAAGGAGAEFVNLMKRAEGMDQGDFLRELNRLGPAVADLALNMAGGNEDMIRVMAESGSAIAPLFDAFDGMRKMGNMNVDQLLKEQEQRDSLTSVLAGFSQAIQDLKANVIDVILNSGFGEAIKELGIALQESVIAIFGASGAEGAAGDLKKGIQDLGSEYFGESGTLTLLVKDFTQFIRDLTTSDNPMELFKTKVGNLATDIKNWFTDTLLGERGANEYGEMGRGERQGGLLKSISDGFSSLFEEGSILTTIKNSISNAFGAAIEGISNFWNDPANQAVIDDFFTDMKDMFSRLVEAIQDAAIQFFAPTEETLSSGDFSSSGTAAALSGEGSAWTAGVNALTGFGELDRDRFLSEAEGGALEWLNSGFNNMLGFGMDDWFEEKIADAVAGGMNPDDARASIAKGLEQYIKDNYSGNELDTMNRYLQETLLPTLNGVAAPETFIEDYGTEQRSIGTLGATGYKFEPKDTVAQLHRGERVLSPEETAKYNSTGNQTMSNEKLDQLNNTMMRVAGLLDSALGVQTRTMKNVKSLGFDYYRGSPA